MRLYVIADFAGSIIGTAHVPAESAEGDDAPTQAAIIPQEGQMLHVVDVPDEVARLPAAELHQRYRLDVESVAKLTELRSGKD